MSTKKHTKENHDPDYSFGEPSAKKSKKFTGKAQNSEAPSTPKPLLDKSNFCTEPTIDDLIYPDATYKSYDEFEERFNQWKAKYHHPFRVASSESLRTEGGAISERFKYRYVVFHCARYGQPRMRGEGKRPNQNYLPCACTAMIRLNFNFNEQCLKLTSLETRHSNHTISQELYEKMVVKDKTRKTLTPKRKIVKTIKNEVMLPEDGADSEHSQDSDYATKSYSTPDYDAPLSRPVPEPVEPVPEPHVAPSHVELQPVQPIFAQELPFAPKPSLFPANIQLLHDYQQNLQSQLMINQMQIQAALTSTYTPFSTADWSNPSILPPPVAPSTSSISPVSSSADENEAPKTFHSLESAAVRPIPLRPSENSAFTMMISKISPIPRADIDSVIGSAHKMLSEGAPEVVQSRLQQLNALLSQWSQ